MNHWLFYVNGNQTPPIYSSLNFFIFLSLRYQNRKIPSLFSQGLRGLQSHHSICKSRVSSELLLQPPQFYLRLELMHICILSSCFFIPFSIEVTSVGEVGAGLCAARAFVCLFVLHVLVFFSPSWCRRLIAVCGCGTRWTFLLTFF